MDSEAPLLYSRDFLPVMLFFDAFLRMRSDTRSGLSIALLAILSAKAGAMAELMYYDAAYVALAAMQNANLMTADT